MNSELETPVLIIGDMIRWRANLLDCGWVVREVESVEDARRLVMELAHLRASSPLAIQTSGSPKEITPLLKFVEESNRELAILAERDIFDSVLVSRFKSVIKDPVRIELKSESLERYMEELEEGINPNEAMVSRMRSSAFSLRLVEEDVSFSKNKMRRIVSRGVR